MDLSACGFLCPSFASIFWGRELETRTRVAAAVEGREPEKTPELGEGCSVECLI